MRLRSLLVPSALSLGLLFTLFACGGQVDDHGGAAPAPSSAPSTDDSPPPASTTTGSPGASTSVTSTPPSSGVYPCPSTYMGGACAKEGDRCFSGSDYCSYREYDCRGGSWTLGVHTDPGSPSCPLPCPTWAPAEHAACTVAYGGRTCAYPTFDGCTLTMVCAPGDAGEQWTVTSTCTDAGVGGGDAARD